MMATMQICPDSDIATSCFIYWWIVKQINLLLAWDASVWYLKLKLILNRFSFLCLNRIYQILIISDHHKLVRLWHQQTGKGRSGFFLTGLLFMSAIRKFILRCYPIFYFYFSFIPTIKKRKKNFLWAVECSDRSLRYFFFQLAMTF